MSNCMGFKSYASIPMHKSKFDLAALRADVAAVTEKPSASDSEEWVIYWYLQGALDYMNEDNIVLHPGNGRSGHTFRSFAATIYRLGKYAKEPQNFALRVFDAEESYGDDPDDWFSWWGVILPHPMYERLSEIGKEQFRHGNIIMELQQVAR